MVAEESIVREELDRYCHSTITYILFHINLTFETVIYIRYSGSIYSPVSRLAGFIKTSTNLKLQQANAQQKHNKSLGNTCA